jgi:hypothetical protein
MKNKRKTEEEVVRVLLETMFLIAGHPDITYDGVLKEGDGWWDKYTMSEKQRDDWFKWGSDYLKKELKLSTVNAHRKMQWIDLMWGLRVVKPQQELEE